MMEMAVAPALECGGQWRMYKNRFANKLAKSNPPMKINFQGIALGEPSKRRTSDGASALSEEVFASDETSVCEGRA